MSLKSRINKLYALKSMLIQAREQAKMKNILNQNLMYNPSFSKEHVYEDVPTYECTGFLVAKKTRKDGIKLL